LVKSIGRYLDVGRVVIRAGVIFILGALRVEERFECWVLLSLFVEQGILHLKLHLVEYILDVGNVVEVRYLARDGLDGSPRLGAVPDKMVRGVVVGASAGSNTVVIVRWL
jgi:hypothetical protein